MRNTDHQKLAPPRLAEKLLEWIVPSGAARHGLLGDLRESYVERRNKTNWLACVLWYWWQALLAATTYGLERLRGRASRSVEAVTGGNGRDSRVTRLYHDARHGVRMLVRFPGMAAASIVALALGIGMPTVMFTIVNGVLRDLPVESPDRIVRLYVTDQVRGGQRWGVRHHDFADWSDAVTTLESVAGYATEDVTVSGGDARPRRYNAAFITANTLSVLGVTPLIGRSFVPDDALPNSPPVAIVSFGVWQSRFGADADVVGRSLTVDGSVHTVIGVLPEHFGFPEREHVWLPLRLALDVSRAESPELEAFARLGANVSLAQVQSELTTVAARLADEYPDTNRDVGIGVMRYQAGLIDDSVSRGLYTMLGAVSFVLLIACVNVANLMIARLVARSREIAVRRALGASRSTILRQFLVESFVLATAGGILGAFIVVAGVSVLTRTLEPLIGLWWVDIRVDAKVVLFVTVLVLGSCIFAGLLPALQASRVNVSNALIDAPRGSAGQGPRLGRLMRGLVVMEIALSCALLIVSAMLIKGVMKLDAIDFGMPVERMVTGEIELPRAVYPTTESRVLFFEELEARIREIPGATAAALMSDIPGTVGFRLPISVDHNPNTERQSVAILTVTPGFLDVLDAPVVDGRTFTTRDRLGSEPVVVINRSLADRFFEERPVGRTVRLGSTDRTVVGVVPDLYMGTIDEPGANGPGLYIPLAQTGNVSMQLFVRSAQDPVQLVPQMRDVLESMDPNLAMMDIARVDRIIARTVAIFDVFGRLFMGFGGVALFLASIGVYGVMSFAVQQRVREWGVRMALGATVQDVIRLMVRRTAVQLCVGLGIGLVIAGMLSMPLANLFYQVEPWDGVVFLSVTALLVATGLFSVLAPLRRALRIDPMRVLREE